MPVLLSISATDLDDESIQDMTQRLCRDIRNEVGIETSLVERPAGPGTKGDLVTIGQILIGAGGPLIALIGVLKTYVARKPFVQFELQTEGGDRVKITADDLRSEDMEKLLQAIKPMVEGRE
jgi:hypothetical protein